ncbi:MAG: GNAT family N-acetyltransferase [Ramlibacter sp.]|nr:GNAT family N-acetyltransferase [Ramlibacter sp.]
MSARVAIAPLLLSDGGEFVAAANASRTLHSPWVSPPHDSSAYRAKVKRMRAPSNYGFAIRRIDTNALVGYVEITNVVRGLFLSAYLGYYAFAGHERQGFMREGIKLAIRYAFQTLRLHRLEANIQPENLASVALVRSCGFIKEGYSPRYLKVRGRWRDHERWALLAR